MNDDRHEGGDAGEAAIDASLRAAFATEPLSRQQLGRIRSGVEAAWRQSVRPARNTWTSRRVAAALLLPLLAATLALSMFRHQSPDIAATYSSGQPGSLVAGAPGAPPAILRTGAPLTTGTQVEARRDGELHWLKGGVLRLRAGARLRILDERHVELQSGSLYVALASPHAADALSVRTALGTVEHIGTQFLLTLDAGSLDIAVREGSLQLQGPRGAAVVAGQAVHLDRNGELSRRTLAPDDPEWAWVGAPLYPFDAEGQSVLALLQWVTLEKGQALVFDSDEARLLAESTTLHGSLRGLSVDQSLSVMLATTTLRARLGDDVLHVHAGPAAPSRR